MRIRGPMKLLELLLLLFSKVIDAGIFMMFVPLCYCFVCLSLCKVSYALELL